MKRTIEEVLTLYEFEPTTRRDIFVEGESDKEIISWYLSESGQVGRSVYAISVIDVPPSVVAAYGLGAGSNRNRVIALAISVWENIDRLICTLSFIVDRDLSYFVAAQAPPVGILVTDYASMDGYLLHRDALQRYLGFVCRFQCEDFGNFTSSFYDVLVFLYSVRVAFSKLQISARIVGAERLLALENGTLAIDEEELIRRSLSVANALGRQAEVVLEVGGIKEAIRREARDPNFFAHGHDAFLVLGECAHKIDGDSSFRNENRVRKALLMGLQFAGLANEGLFRRVA